MLKSQRNSLLENTKSSIVKRQDYISTIDYCNGNKKRLLESRGSPNMDLFESVDESSPHLKKANNQVFNKKFSSKKEPFCSKTLINKQLSSSIPNKRYETG